MRKSLTVILLVLLSAVMIGAGALLVATKKVPSPEDPTPEPPLVRHIEAKPETLTLAVKANGTVRPRTRTTLVAEVAGKILDIAPDLAEGSFCSADDVLLRIDTEDLGHQRTRAAHQLAQAKLRHAVETREAALARKEWKRNGEGEPDPMTIRLPQLEETRAAVGAAEADIEQIDLLIKRCEIRAPWSARIRAKHADLGQYVAPGTPLLELYPVDAAEVDLPVSGRDLAFIDLPPAGKKDKGPEAVLTAMVGGNRAEWTGSVVRTGAEIDSRTRMMTLVVRVEDPFCLEEGAPDHPLTPGLFVDASITGIECSDIFIIPRHALRTGDQLILIDDENALRFRDVDVLRREKSRVIIRKGLKAGERICLSPLETPVDGMKVRISDAPEDGEPR